MAHSPEVVSEAPRVQQTLRLPVSELEAIREWAIDGTGLAAASRVVDPDGRIALIQNGWTDGWFLPGGTVEPDETLPDAARREVREETGLDATVEGPLVVLDQTYVAENGGTEWFSALFVVYSATAEGTIPDPSRLGVTGEEIAAARWFDTLPDNIHEGELLRPYL